MAPKKLADPSAYPKGAAGAATLPTGPPPSARTTLAATSSAMPDAPRTSAPSGHCRPPPADAAARPTRASPAARQALAAPGATIDSDEQRVISPPRPQPLAPQPPAPETLPAWLQAPSAAAEVVAIRRVGDLDPWA